ncbi:MAG: calcium-binding protein [Pseudomonadota bacterium]
MTTTVFDTNTVIGSGVVWTSAAVGDSALVLESVTAISTATAGFVVDNSEVEVQVFGLLASTFGNALFFDNGDDSTVYIGQTGTVSSALSYFGSAGIYAESDDVDIVNDGTIVGGSGIYINGDSSYIENTGTIRTTSDEDNDLSLAVAGISLGAASAVGTATSHTVINYGLISGLEYSIINTNGNFRNGNSSANIENHGTLQGAVELGDLNDRLINTGTINGTVDLGGGSDTYIGRGDSSVSHAVTGGNGNDHLAGGTGDDTLIGGNGNDTVRGADGDDMLSSLNGNASMHGGRGDDTLDGGSGNDTLLGGRDNDMLIGNGGNDLMLGHAGNDTLDGGAGRDTIEGGVGTDVITGGTAADIFVFKGNFGNDTITDFNSISAGEKIDLSGVGAIADFADLAANHMTQSGTSVIIDAGRGNTITVERTDISNMDAGDFLF